VLTRVLIRSVFADPRDNCGPQCPCRRARSPPTASTCSAATDGFTEPKPSAQARDSTRRPVSLTTAEHKQRPPGDAGGATAAPLTSGRLRRRRAHACLGRDAEARLVRPPPRRAKPSAYSVCRARVPVGSAGYVDRRQDLSTGIRPDWTAITIGAAFALLAAALLVLSLPDALPACTSVTTNMDGDGGAPCGNGLAWDAQSVVGAGVASICGLLAVICFAFLLAQIAPLVRRWAARALSQVTSSSGLADPASHGKEQRRAPLGHGARAVTHRARRRGPGASVRWSRHPQGCLRAERLSCTSSPTRAANSPTTTARTPPRADTDDHDDQPDQRQPPHDTTNHAESSAHSLDNVPTTRQYHTAGRRTPGP
jgi:hypothetical protein